MLQNNNSGSLKAMTEEIRRIYRSNPRGSAAGIELYLEETLKGLQDDERQSIIRELAHQFDMRGVTSVLSSPVVSNLEDSGFSEQREYSHLFTLLFGKHVSKFDLSSEEHLEKLAVALNTIFDSLNQIIGVIHTTLLGEQSELETIRHIIGTDIEGQSRTDSLQDYLDQIRKAFLVAHMAYQQAAKSKVKQIMVELSPEKISAGAKGGLRFGPMKKAELYEIFEDRYNACNSWFESGRLMEELLREFEKISQKLYYNADNKVS